MGPGPQDQGGLREDLRLHASNGWRLGDGVAMLNRLKLEGTNTKADIVLGLDTNLTAEAQATGLFGTHGAGHGAGQDCRSPGPTTISCPIDYAHFAVDL